MDEGHYSTEDEIVADALRLMQARDEVVEIKRARLRDAIERGYEDAAAGNVIRLENNTRSTPCEAPRAHSDRPRGSEIDTPLFPKDVGFRSHRSVHGGSARYLEGTPNRNCCFPQPRRPRTRPASSGRHCVFCEADKSHILVVRVLHDRMDYQRRLEADAGLEEDR